MLLLLVGLIGGAAVGIIMIVLFQSAKGQDESRRSSYQGD